MSIKYADPRKITIREGFNPRYDMGDIQELKAQILNEGIKVPVFASEGDNGEIILGSQGHRRLQAVLQLIKEKKTTAANGVDLTAFPYMVESADVTDEVRTLELLTLNTGKPLEMLEEAEVYGRILSGLEGDALKLKRKELATKTGRSITHIFNCEQLLTMSDSVKRQIKKGAISASLVVTIISEVRSGSGKNPDVAKVAAVVEKEVLAMIAKAEASGKAKTTAKDKAPKEKGEGNDEGKAEKDAAKAELKEAKALKGRMEKIGEYIDTLDSDDKAVKQIIVSMQTLIAALRGGNVKLTDIKAEINAAGTLIEKDIKEAVAAALKAAKE